MTILVSAAVIIEDGRVLVTRRKKGVHLEGLWEFPGGKVEDGEDPRLALVRELREEIGIVANVAEILDVTFHRYEDEGKSVLLMFFETSIAAGSPAPRAIEVAEIAFLESHELKAEEFPPADVALLRKIQARLEKATTP